MVLPGHQNALAGADAVHTVTTTPKWTQVTFSEQNVARPQEGLIVVAYAVEAAKDNER